MAPTSGRMRELREDLGEVDVPGIRAAGCVVLGRDGSVLLVHRPKYDDWSFPKGKLERAEHATAAAVREVEEEAGVRVRLGVPLDDQCYRVREGMKTVQYWVARPARRQSLRGFEPNAEIDEATWFPIDKARRRLTYHHDGDTLEQALERAGKTRTLVVLRHGKARSRKTWRRKDSTRPLLATGQAQAVRLVPLLGAYDVTRLVTSSSTRCMQTLEPYAGASGWPLRREAGLSEEDATRAGVRTLVAGLVEGLGDRSASAGGLVVCSHRPVLPWVFDAVGVDDPGLAPGEMLVAHLRKGRVHVVERHLIS